MSAINISAQPATGQTLQNFSLNVVTNPSVVSFLNSSIVVYNPVIDGAKRFQFVNDSSQGLVATSPDQIKGIQGFTLSGGTSYTGIGGMSCHPNDPYCAMTPNGPAWLIASVTSRTIPMIDSGSAEYFVQIGANGINHVGETTSQTSVIFGTGSGPVYNASTNREITLDGDTADFVLNAVPQSLVVDTYWIGGDGQWNQIVDGGSPTWLHHVYLDAGTLTVAGSQQANLTTVNGGRLHIGTGSSLASDIAIGASGTISGDGWVGQNLMLNGELALSSGNPLLVMGTANITGGSLGLAAGFNPPIGQEFAALTAIGGLQGTLNVIPGPLPNSNLTLASIRYTAESVLVTLSQTGVPGDFNHDGSVDAADYVVWRKTDGMQAGFNSWWRQLWRIDGFSPRRQQRRR